MRFSIKYPALIFFGAVLASALPSEIIRARDYSSNLVARGETSPEVLKAATLIVLKDMKEIEVCKNSVVTLIGGQAIIHYVQGSRTTEDVDLLSSAPKCPASVKNELIAKFADRYKKESEVFEVKVNEAWVQVDVVPMDQYGKKGDVRAIPALAGGSAKDLASLSDDDMPWATVSDLIVMKVFSMPIRAQPAKKKKDQDDINLLAKYGHENKAPFTPSQKEYVEKQLKFDVDEKLNDFDTVKAALQTYFGITPESDPATNK